ncbi:hypothetical protein TcWFU_002989 [Taenia crassiceps]|uniref:Uncharacterized protein n=1 Tax=Taenia crassiceps TaxID=6207 RepID=A0ABR4Q820_9CEST
MREVGIKCPSITAFSPCMERVNCLQCLQECEVFSAPLNGIQKCRRVECSSSVLFGEDSFHGWLSGVIHFSGLEGTINCLKWLQNRSSLLEVTAFRILLKELCCSSKRIASKVEWKKQQSDEGFYSSSDLRSTDDPYSFRVVSMQLFYEVYQHQGTSEARSFHDNGRLVLILERVPSFVLELFTVRRSSSLASAYRFLGTELLPLGMTRHFMVSYRGESSITPYRQGHGIGLAWRHPTGGRSQWRFSSFIRSAAVTCGKSHQVAR